MFDDVLDQAIDMMMAGKRTDEILALFPAHADELAAHLDVSAALIAESKADQVEAKSLQHINQSLITKQHVSYRFFEWCGSRTGLMTGFGMLSFVLVAFAGSQFFLGQLSMATGSGSVAGFGSRQLAMAPDVAWESRIEEESAPAEDTYGLSYGTATGLANKQTALDHAATAVAEVTNIIEESLTKTAPAPSPRVEALREESSISLQTRYVEQTLQNIEALTHQSGGWIDAKSFASDKHDKANITIRIPIDAYDNTVSIIRSLGTELDVSLSATNQAELKNNLEQQITNPNTRQYERESLREQLRVLDDQLTFATIHISLTSQSRLSLWFTDWMVRGGWVWIAVIAGVTYFLIHHTLTKRRKRKSIKIDGVEII